ncbi:MAG TPA: hypothetical protein VFZ52_19105 [Chryseolinea sp.]
MIRKVTFYWILLTLMLVDSWLLSKPNILGKIGLIIYKYHYLRSFPRTLLTVWIVVSISILIVLLIQYLVKQGKLSKVGANLILGACLCASLLIMAKVYVDFTSWSYSHTGIKFRYGAYMLPMIVMIVFGNGIMQISIPKPKHEASSVPFDGMQVPEISAPLSHDTSQP